MKIWYIGAALIISASSTVYGGAKDGNRLLDACSAITLPKCNCSDNAYDRFNSGYCFGLMNGVIDLLAVNHAFTEQRFCLPNGGSLGQYARVIVKYLNENPEKLHQDGSILAINALMQAFPCEK